MTTVLVTGANRGLGLEFVRQYAEDGADVIACCREPEKAAALNALAKSKKSVTVMALDVRDPKSVKALKDRVGDTPIDIVINNAGISGPRGRTEGDFPFEANLQVFAVNSLAPVMVAYALRENLKAGKEKKLVTITSQLGSIANHGGGASAYNASKAAVNSFMHGLSKSWAKDGIRVGIFHPGWVSTDMGGASAPVTPPQSVSGLRARIAELNEKNSGRFVDYQGKDLPW
ncbi:MAG: SDR family oxidoreductase [Alphaproteobacteria bacterium]|nr:SDR family oxidoreductase [Alphaproteobacteria bacterium]MBL6936839.1 SDR family oxidoreductase [Alphaproteobacteria bacterium]MBL7097608.1 SDR family oxidoreductase [Alphaproteobacteria bacterium]